MIDNVFDRVVRNILLKFKIGYDPKSWDRLEAKLDKSDREDIIFDNLISEKLKSYSVPLSSGAFAKFEKKYLDNNPRKFRGLYYASGIAAALLLLVYSVFLFKYDKLIPSKSNIDNQVASTEVSKNIDKKVITDSQYGNSQDSNQKFTMPAEQKNNKDSNTILAHFKNDTKRNNNSIVDIDYGLNYRYGRNINNQYSSFPYINYDLYNRSLNFVNERNYLENSMMPFDIVFKLRIESTNQDQNIEKRGDAKNDVYSHDEIANNKFSNNNELKNDLTKEKKDSIPVIAAIPSLSGLGINAFVAPTASIINTPNDIEFKIPGYTQASTGYSFGLSMSYRKNKSEVESGLEYSSIGYSPKKNIVNKGNANIYLANIYYSLLSLPVNFKYHFYQKDNWDIYTLAGISANMIASSKFKFIETIEESGNIYNLEKFAKDLQEDLGFQQTLYAKKQYENGVTNGGDVKSNIFLAGNFGIGIKKDLKNGFSMYFEPQFKYNFNKFGPNNDNIQDFSFKFGLSKTISL